MLALKLLLVPSFVLVLSLAGRRLGPSVAGWLAGFPVIAGPVLFVLAFEQGRAFAADAAAASAAGIFSLVGFLLSYARAASRRGWRGALLEALVAWAAAAVLVTRLPAGPWIGLAVASATLLAAPRFFPAPAAVASVGRPHPGELALRMAAGAALTCFVSVFASVVGSRWSGAFVTFPVLGTVLAVSTHRSDGAAHAAALLRAMVKGLYASAAFCVSLAFVLRASSLATGFAVALAAGMAAQAATRRTMVRPRSALE